MLLSQSLAETSWEMPSVPVPQKMRQPKVVLKESPEVETLENGVKNGHAKFSPPLSNKGILHLLSTCMYMHMYDIYNIIAHAYVRRSLYKIYVYIRIFPIINIDFICIFIYIFSVLPFILPLLSLFVIMG